MAKMEINLGPAMAALVKRFSLDIGTVGSNYRVEDSFIGRFYAGSNDESKRGIYIKRKLEDAIQAAIDFRKVHDAEMQRRSGFSTEPVKATPKPVTPPMQIVTASPEVKKVAKAVGAVVVSPPKPRVMIDIGPIDDDTVYLDIDDVELDNTGERLKKYREPPRYSKSESSFLRAARVLVQRPHIEQEALAKKAVLALTTTGTCRVAFNDIVTTLNEAGFLNAAGKRMLEQMPKLKHGVPK